MSEPFKYLDRITWSKDTDWGEQDDIDFVPFLVNRHFSQFPDTVLYANDINMQHHLSPRLQFLYLLSSLPKRKRFGKWKKKTETPDIAVISTFLNCSEDKAVEFAPLITPPQMEVMRQYYEQLNGSGSRNVRRGKTKRP